MAGAEQHDPANAGSRAGPDPSRDLTWLAFQAASALADVFNKAARDAGLSDLRDWLVLALISDGTDRTQLEIASELSIDKSTLVPILDRLEKSGLLARTGSQRDRRVRIPRSTPAGQQAVRTVAIARDNAINERLAAIPPDERAAFHATLFSIVRLATP